MTDAYHMVKVRLDALILNYSDEERYQLPPEDQLAVRLGVSRPTIRSALLALEKEGKLRRIHGRGTFINRYAAHLPANVSEDRPFVEVISALGYSPTVRTLAVRVVTLRDDLSDSLGLPAGTPGLAIERLFEADQNPAVFSIDYVSISLLVTDHAQVEAGSSTFDFIARNTDREVQYSVAELVPVVPNPAVRAHLRSSAREAALLL
ncbi:MAG: GntR family transcriptional regulator, partial [Mycobacteriales bacterium]